MAHCLPVPRQAASAFSEKITRTHKMGVCAFDGSPRITRVVGFTSSPGAVASGLARLSTRKPRDPSTNLNGAVVNALAVLERALMRSRKPLRFGTLLVFTDGTDRAHRVPEEEMHAALDDAQVNVFAIGLGPEISVDQLSRLGRHGFVQADDQGKIGSAFDEVAARIEAASKQFYLLSYCSPARAGTHSLRVEVTVDGVPGGLEYEFDAKGFGPGATPTANRASPSAASPTRAEGAASRESPVPRAHRIPVRISAIRGLAGRSAAEQQRILAGTPRA